MADDILKSLFVSLGWKNDEAGQKKVERSVADYEKTVREAEKRVEAARRAAAATTQQTDEQMARDDLRAAREALRAAKETEEAARKVAAAKQKEAKESAEAIALAITKLNLFVDATIAAGQKIGSAIGGAITGLAQLNYVAGRTGASVQSIKGLGYAFSQVGGSVGQAMSALESFARSTRTNEGLAGFVKDLGVDTTKDKALQLLDVIDTLKKEGYQVGSQQAEMLGIPEETFNLLARYGDQVRHFYAERAKAAKDFHLDEEEAAKASARLMQGLGSLSATVEVAFTKLLTSAAPRLSKWIDDLRDWIQSHQKEIGEFLEWIAQKVEWVGQKITEFVEGMAGTLQDKEKQKAFDEWKQGFTDIGNAAQRLLDLSEKLANSNLWKVLKLLTIDNPLANWPLRLLSSAVGTAEASTGGGGLNAQASSVGAVPPDERSMLQKILPKALGGRDAPAAGDGSRSWRNNNPGNLKDGPFARAHGAVGVDDKGFARFPSYDAGRKAQESLLFDDPRYKRLSIKDAIAKYAPAGDGNDPTGYAAQVARAAGVGVDAPLSSLTPEQRGRFLDAQQRKEGWIPGFSATSSDAPAPAGTPRLRTGLATVRASSGRTFQVAAEFAANFQGFIDDYEKAGGVIGPHSGGNNERPGNASYHPVGRAIDVNQVGRGVRAGGRTLPLDVEDALAAKWGLRSGNSFRSNDNGHFEVHRAEMARAAIERMKAQTDSDRTITRALTAPTPRPVLRMDPGGFDVNALTRPASPLATGSVTNSSSSTSKVLNQTNNYNVDIKDSRGPEAHAKAFKDTGTQMGQLHLENAQRAFA
ncbi:hypothetical protein SAMN05216360_12527 [Methylobacterium phyllostachyos]|uniref:D-alanyl-D-alanine carboxypeptidase n=1 Tax=Methylobacterium phyllostachyos TaxID=582672 RepID=A0A1H0K7R2_9HYPH|nr:hypothetical protein [Methylobacterium phyllostachyos]SDO51780.1 hypothetical protein SAMN05216360_12527 [Methylobacterium phyllostachyos]